MGSGLWAPPPGSRAPPAGTPQLQGQEAAGVPWGRAGVEEAGVGCGVYRVSCSRREREGPRCCPGADQVGPGRTAAHRSWSVTTAGAGLVMGPPLPQTSGSNNACGSTEGQLADRAPAHWPQGLPGRWGRGRVVQLGSLGPSAFGGVQPRWPRVVGWVQVTSWCHLRKERRMWYRGPGAPWGTAPRPLGPSAQH